MVFNNRGIVIIGTRNHRPAVNWPGVAVGTALVASIIVASSCCFWYLATGAMMPWGQLMGNTILFTGFWLGSSIGGGRATPVEKLPPLDHSSAS